MKLQACYDRPHLVTEAFDNDPSDAWVLLVTDDRGPDGAVTSTIVIASNEYRNRAYSVKNVHEQWDCSDPIRALLFPGKPDNLSHRYEIFYQFTPLIMCHVLDNPRYDMLALYLLRDSLRRYEGDIQ